jgi:hypothetical protein
MASVDPSHPPAGVGGYTDAKPQFASQQQQQAFTPDPYANQGALSAQQNYADPSVSPNPQYHAGSPQYAIAPAPYNVPVSPSPQQAFYGNDVKQGYQGLPLGGASELGGETSGAAPVTHSAPAHQAAELVGHSNHCGTVPFTSSEHPGTAPNYKPVV